MGKKRIEKGYDSLGRYRPQYLVLLDGSHEKPPRDPISTTEAAKILGVAQQTLWGWVRLYIETGGDRGFRGYRAGTRWLFSRAAVMKRAKELEQQVG